MTGPAERDDDDGDDDGVDRGAVVDVDGGIDDVGVGPGEEGTAAGDDGATRARVSSSGPGLLSASVPIAKPTARQRSMLWSAGKNAKSLVRQES